MAQIMLEKYDNGMLRENEVDDDNLNNKDEDAHYALSDDSDIEILTADDAEEDTSILKENNLENTEEETQNSYIESLETNNEVEIINLSSDDEETNNSEDNILVNQSEVIYCLSEDSDSSSEQVAIEIETENEKININQNNLNLDELFLGSDEECVMFDFSNYSADDVLRAVENNKLFIEGSENVNSEKAETNVECNVQIEESKISVKNTKTKLDTGQVNKKNIKNKPRTTKVPIVYSQHSTNSVQLQSICDKNKSVNYKKNNKVNSEVFLKLKCRACATPGTTEINSNIENAAYRRCPNCETKMSFQCETCTVLFHSVLSFYNHLKNFHIKDNEEILQRIDNLNLTYKKNIRNRLKALKEHKTVKKLKTTQKSNNVETVVKGKVLYNCVNCAQKFLSRETLRNHKIDCQNIPYLYCRFCPLNITTVAALREHMIQHHLSKINQSDLNQVLNGIEQEAQKLTDMKSSLLVTCIRCKYIEPLDRRERQCYRCRSSLMYKCGIPNCGQLLPTLNELFAHMRKKHLHTWHRCDICGSSFTECGDATRHRQLHHPECRVTYRHCRDCHYEASSPGDMSSHVHSAHTSRLTMPVEPYRGPYACKACGRVFKMEHRLWKHVRSFCRKTCRTYRCAHCRYTSLHKSKLIGHLRCSHVYLFIGRNLKCHRCGIELASIYTLNNHMGKCKGKTRF